jgi:hypothetical protein
VYDAGSGVLPKALAREADQLFEALDAACGGALRAAERLLARLSASPDALVTHVVVGGSQLVPLLAKLLLLRLDGGVGLTQVYSAAAVPKAGAFKRVRAKYGPRARYIVLGGGQEEEAAAALMQWPFVRVLLHPAAPPPPPQQPAASGASGGEAAGRALSPISAGGSTRAEAAAGSKQAAGAAGASAQRLDALRSAGHTLQQLSADRIVGLALSLRS